MYSSTLTNSVNSVDSVNSVSSYSAVLPLSLMVFLCVCSFYVFNFVFSLLFLCFLFHALSTCVWPRVKGKVASCDLAKLRSFFNRVLIFLAQLVGCVCLLFLWDTFQYGW